MKRPPAAARRGDARCSAADLVPLEETFAHALGRHCVGAGHVCLFSSIRGPARVAVAPSCRELGTAAAC